MYIGDGVYIEFDGFHFVLKANSEINPTDVIYLEPEMIDMIVEFKNKRKELP